MHSENLKAVSSDEGKPVALEQLPPESPSDRKLSIFQDGVEGATSKIDGIALSKLTGDGAIFVEPRASSFDLLAPQTAVANDDLFTTWLNHILRMSDRPHVGQTIVQPVQYRPTERDHFFEVQHIVTLIMEDGTWLQTPIVQYMDLASFVNEERNLFRIEARFNQNKKSIPFNTYRNNAEITNYLLFRVGNGTVEDSVKALASAMVARQGANAALTRKIGARVKQIMGWP